MKPKFTEEIIQDLGVDTIYISMNDPETGRQIGRTESRWYGYWHLGDIWVDTILRRQGLGTTLINETCSRLWARNLAPITVDAVPQDQSITQEELNIFYRVAGFASTKIERRFRRTSS